MREKGKVGKIGLYGPYGWGNLGDASIQEAAMFNIRRRCPEAEFVGFSLNPDNTEEIHGIRSVPVLSTWRPRRRRTSAAPTPSEDGQAPPRQASTQPPRRGGIRGAVKRVPLVYPLLRGIKSWMRPLFSLGREVRFLGRAYKMLRDFDLLVLSGGGQLSDDWGGPWDHPYTFTKWMACARLAGAKVYVMSVGAGPIRAPLTGVFIRWALHLAQYRSYRDVESLEFLKGRGIRLPASVYPDLAFSLPCEIEAPPSRGSKASVGISPLCYFYPVKGAWPEQDDRRYERYMAMMSTLATSVLEDGHPVILFSSQIRNDRYAFDDLLKALQSQGFAPGRDRLEAVHTENLEHLLAQIAETDVVVTSRFHGVLLSYLQGKAVISLSYDPKIDALMRDFGQSDYCLDIDEATSDLLRDRLRSLMTGLDATRDQIRRQAMENRLKLEGQYDQLFGAPVAPKTAEDAADRLGAS